MTLTISLAVIIASGATAFMSSIFGMVGGLILMGLLASLLPIAQALVLHGIIQLTSNGYRAYLNRKDIAWPIFIQFAMGGAASMLCLSFLSYSPDRATVYVLLGLLPFIGLSVPERWALDITRPFMALLAGFAVIATNLLAGVGGPILDVFFQRVPLTRHQVVAGKALAQALGHSSKIIFYGHLFNLEPVSPYFILVCLLASIVGTTLGKRVLDRMADQNFFLWTRRIMLAVGAVFIVRGLTLILS